MEIFSAFGLSASAGLNAYLPLLIVSISAKIGLFQLREPFDLLGSWWAIGILVVLTLVEVFVDKVPAADTANDVIGTVIRPAAGAVLFAASSGVATEVPMPVLMGLGLLTAGSVHGVKTVSRPAVTVSTAGMGNPVVSTVEDIVSALTSVLAILLPGIIAIVAVFGIVLFLVWRIRRINRRQRRARLDQPTA
jgi:hypothetical protein